MADVWRMIGQRLALGFLTLFLISLIIFGASELLPGDFAEAVLGQSATPETVAASAIAGADLLYALPSEKLAG